MGLEEFRAAGKYPGCGMNLILNKLAEEDGARYDDLTDALADRSIGPKAISIVLKRWGYPLTERVVSRHRMEACSCPSRPS